MAGLIGSAALLHLKGFDVKPVLLHPWKSVLKTGLLLPVLSHAYSVGGIQVDSAMGEPLRAQVLVSGLDAQDGALAAQSASDIEMAQFGVQAAGHDGHLRFETRPAGAGKVLLLIRSDRPVNDPYLDVVVRFKSQKASRVQHMVALIAPPKASRPVPLIAQSVTNVPSATAETPLPVMRELPPELPLAASSTALPAAERSLQVSSLPPPELPVSTIDVESPDAADSVSSVQGTIIAGTALQATPTESVNISETIRVLSNSDVPSGATTAAAATAPAPADPAPKPAPQSTASRPARYTVRTNDSLWKIAKRLESQLGQPAAQIATQLHQLNRRAFFNGDPNRLKSGVELTLPHTDTPPPQVVRAVIVPPAAPVAKKRPLPAAPAPVQVIQRSRKTANTQLTLVAPTAAGLSTGNTEKNGRDRGPQPLSRELAGQVSQMRQKTASLRKEVLELDAQVNLNDQKIAMQNARLAELQQRLKARKEAQQRRSKSLHSVPVAALGALMLGLGTLLTEPAHAAPAEAASSGGSMLPILLGVLAVLAIAAFVFMRNKGKPATKPLPKPQAPASRPAATKPAAPATPKAVDTATKPAAVPAAEPAVTVDALAEAKNFINQDRLPQAVGVLNRALNSQPKRVDLMLMLLDIYLLQQDREGFDQVFAQLQAVAGASELAQAEALQARFPVPEPVAEKSDSLEFNKVDITELAEAQPQPSTVSLDDHHTESALEFTYSESTTREASAEVSLDDLEAELSSSLPPLSQSSSQDQVTLDPKVDEPLMAELDLGHTAADLAASPVATPEAKLPDQPVDLQFDLDDTFTLEEPASDKASEDWAGDLATQDFALPAKHPSSPEGAPLAAAELTFDAPVSDSTLNQQISAFDAALPAQAAQDNSALNAGLGYNGQLAEEFGFLKEVDPQALNLDLARQYAGLGEMEGAYELLDEVIAQGNAEQQAQARQIKAQLTQ